MQRPAEERFREIHDRCAPAVAAYVRRRAPVDVVDDIVAETFLVCWRRLDDMPEEPLPWLYGVARKVLANARRSAARQRVPLFGETSAEPPPLPGDPVLAVAFAQLSEPDREVLRLVAWEGLPLSEAATVLGCLPLTCRVRFHRAKRRLAGRLEQLELESAVTQPRPHPGGATR